MVAAVTVTTRVVGLFLYLFEQRLLRKKNKKCELHNSELLPFLYEKRKLHLVHSSVSILTFIHEMT